MDDMKLLGSLESYGGRGSFKGSVSIASEKFNALSEEARDSISWKASDFLQLVREAIDMEWAKVNEADKRNEHVSKLTGLFKSAGFDIPYVETIGNEYCSQACCYKYPWVMVTTQKGHIKLGWRKRVINIDWSESDIDLDGNEIFKDEKVTTGDKYVHAWGYEKAIEYLTKLNSGEKL